MKKRLIEYRTRLLTNNLINIIPIINLVVKVFFSHEIKTDYLINSDNPLIRKPESAKPHRI